MRKHTPLPWVARKESVFAGSGDEIAGDYIAQCYDNRIYNAAFIVKACNNHYELLEALKECREAILNMSKTARETGHYGDVKDDECPCTICKIDKAIAKAEAA